MAGQAGAINLMANNFNADLAYSQTASEEQFWADVYRKAFPNIVNQMPCPGDYESQRMGIDRVILLSNGMTLRVDEKKRRIEYSDILIEFLSNDKTGALGWIEKNLAINYIAYAFMESRRVYLLDWMMLKRAWHKFGDDWKRRYPIIKAQNKTYTTHSVAVPTNVLLGCMRTAIIIEV